MHKQPLKQSPIDRIVQTIISKLEEGVRPWRRNWDVIGSGRPCRSNGQPYRGINYFLLSMMGDSAGYTSPFWLTYKTAQSIGGQVRRGESASPIMFYKSYSTTQQSEADDAGSEQNKRVLKCYSVFNAQQIEGLPAEFYPEVKIRERTHNLALKPLVDDIVGATGAKISHGGDMAYYRPSSDSISMPTVEQFHGYEQYVATLMHELVHWTSHPSRCDRQLGKRFGDQAYAVEEAIAEMGAATLCDAIGIPTDHMDDHASYIGGWMKILKAEPKALLTFAAKAEQAAAYIYPNLHGRLAADFEAEERDAA